MLHSLDDTSPYSAGGGAYSSAALRQTATNIYFPKTDGVTFEQANAPQIIGEYFKYGFDGVPLLNSCGYVTLEISVLSYLFSVLLSSGWGSVGKKVMPRTLLI